MCGIAGALVSSGAWTPERLTAVRLAMSAALRHRGPDAHGHHEEPGMFLDVNRLAIVDVAGGVQPLADETGRVVVAFNGEIYNHGCLRAALAGRGHRLGSASDGEVIPHLYEELGPDFPSELDGMFAIALWDGGRRRMVLARDRFGEKPLYLARRGRDSFFASELHALAAGGLTGRRVSAQAVDDYLSLRYVPGPATIYTDVDQVPPGSAVSIDGEVASQRRYWQVRFVADSRLDRETACAALRDRLGAAVAGALQGDRRAGVLLSGGLDSSSVLATAVAAGHRLPAYTVRYAEHGDTDGAYAARVCEWLSVPHRPVWLSGARCAELLPEAVAALDQPNADQSLIGLYAIARSAASDGVPVLLGGDGADELLAGYRYYGRELRRRHADLPRSGVAVPLGLTPRSECIVDDFRSMTDWRSAELKRRLYRRHVLRDVDPLHHLRLIAEAAGPDPPTFLEQMLLVDLRMWLPGALLAKLDRLMMARSVEARSPYLAGPVADLALSLPHEVRLHRGRRKDVLKRAMRGVLPHWVRHRPKRGFVPPTGTWLRAGPVHDLAREVLAGGALREAGWFEPAALRRLLDQHASGAADHDDLLWTLLVLGLWLRATRAPR